MREKIFLAIYKFIEKNYLPVIIVSILLGGFFLMAFLHVPLKSDYIDLLPQDSEPVKNLKYLSEKLKGVGQFSVVIESDTKDVESMGHFADLLNEELMSIPEIQYVQYKVPKDFIMNNFYLFLETEDLEEIYNRLREKVQYELWKDAPFFINLEDEDVEFDIQDIVDKYQKKSGSFKASSSDYMISSDNDVLVMFLKPGFMPTEVDKTGVLLGKIEQKIKEIKSDFGENDLNVSFAGTYVLSYDQKNAIYQDIKLTSLLALVLVFIAILVFIRNIKSALFLLYALGVGVLSAFGAAYIFLGHINLITAFLIAILTGLGVNYGIHFLFRYNEELSFKTHESALRDAFVITMPASLTGALTTAVSFFTLAFSRFLGFSEFGLLSSIGIMVTLISAYFVVASLLLFFRKKDLKAKSILKKEESIKEKDKLIIKKVVLYSALILALLTLIFAPFLKNLSFEYNSRKLEVRGQKSIETTELIQKKFNISTDPAIFYTYEREEENDFYNSIKEKMKNDQSLIGSILSISLLVNSEEEQKNKIGWIAKMKKELETLPENSIKDRELLKKIDVFYKLTKNMGIITEDDLSPGLKRRFVASDGDKNLYITQVFPGKILFDAKEMKKYVDEIKVVEGKKNNYYPTGMHILYVYLIDTVLGESKIFLSIVFIIIWLLLLLDFRNIKDSLIAMVPLVFGVLWLLEIMSLFGVKFNFMNIVVFPTVLGTGVDNGVHIYHRYKERGDLFDAVIKTGTANLGMSITVALGWSALSFAHYQGLKTMAFVGVVGILMTFVASITIMPAVIMFFDKNNLKRE